MSKNGSKTGLRIAVVLLSMFLVGSFITNLGLTTALLGKGLHPSSLDYPKDENPDYEEIWSYGYGTSKVVHIELEGVIMRGGKDGLFGSQPGMAETVLKQIRAASVDPDVKAILLEVDSPGGAVTPSDEIYRALRDFKELDESRQVLVFIRGLGASGAYYAAMAGDYILAEPTAIVGSIGVIMETLNMKGLGDKLGLKAVTITSGSNKDMLNPLKEVNPLHVQMLQGVVDDMYNRFASIVEESRLPPSHRELMDGRILTANVALREHFIDGIGYWPEALFQMQKLLGVDDIRLIRYAKKKSFLETIFEAKAPHLPQMSAPLSGPRFLYQWKP